MQVSVSSVILSQVTLGAVFSYAIQVLKNAKWFPVLQQDGTKIANIVASIIASGAAITGLTYVHDPVAHTLLITNFSWALVGTSVWHWLTQYVIQHGWYKIAFDSGNGKMAAIGVTGSIDAHALKIQQLEQKLKDAQTELEKAKADK